MPDILITENNKVFHKKLDFLFGKVIKPSIKEILLKHKLFTNLNLDMEFPELKESDIFSEHDTGVYKIADSPGIFKFQLNTESTNISFGYFTIVVDNEEIESDQFRLGRYTLNK